MKFNCCLRQLLEITKTSKKDFAAHLGVTPTFIYYLETNQRIPSLEMASKIAIYFKCYIEEIWEPI